MNADAGSAAAEAASPNVPRALHGRRWLSWLLMLVIFASGAAVGGAGMLLLIRDRALTAIHHPEQAAPQMAARVGRHLGLSAEQVSQVERIIRHRQTNIAEIRRQVQPRVMSELALLESEISQVLGPDQRARWHALCERLRNTWVPPLPPEPKDNEEGERKEEG